MLLKTSKLLILQSTYTTETANSTCIGTIWHGEAPPVHQAPAHENHRTFIGLHGTSKEATVWPASTEILSTNRGAGCHDGGRLIATVTATLPV